MFAAVTLDSMPHIVNAHIAAGHDGQPELILSLRFANGAVSQVAMENELGIKLMAHCGAQQLNELTGQPWHRVLEILPNNPLQVC